VTDATPTVLRTKIRSSPSESVRKSCWEATRQVGPFLLANGFPEIIAERNRFARTLGFVDFYDMKVTQAEGFSKKTCFEMLDGLETATKPLLDAALTKLEQEKGADSLKPWNLSYALSGELTKLTDPYFPFENAPEVWGRSFSAMGISYKGTTMVRLAARFPNPRTPCLPVFCLRRGHYLRGLSARNYSLTYRLFAHTVHPYSRLKTDTFFVTTTAPRPLRPRGEVPERVLPLARGAARFTGRHLEPVPGELHLARHA
jgi:hypothetical protein